MVEVDIPQSLFEEQGRQLYGANLLEIQVSSVFKPLSLLYMFPFFGLCTDCRINFWLRSQG